MKKLGWERQLDECQGLGQVSKTGCGVASLDCDGVMK